MSGESAVSEQGASSRPATSGPSAKSRPAFHDLFARWPESMPRRGILITTQGEQIPFSDFLLGEDLLYLDRTTPDSSGARAFVLPYTGVAGVKFTDVVKRKAIRSLGFEGPPARDGA
jgi:hypothetical protein